ncbi:hypothetical protein [Knoellia koreensis]|uniref:Uncharacterized protein n=1 Tax=Knoellia koreensis TaxID=2730921 RepID=A0A849H476_9MICO|nr:hypothetical protein [Knoellia sp. DB2414S]NNM44600.1 hypothetical protein [Knoellia sp. DB2414S]
MSDANVTEVAEQLQQGGHRKPWHIVIVLTTVDFDVALCGRTIPHARQELTTVARVDREEPQHLCRTCDIRRLEAMFKV